MDELERLNRRLGGLRFTKHALHRMEEMGLTGDEVRLVVADSELSYTQNNYDNDGRVFQREGLAVVTDKDVTVVITVLYRKQEQWTRGAKDE